MKRGLVLVGIVAGVLLGALWWSAPSWAAGRVLVIGDSVPTSWVDDLETVSGPVVRSTFPGAAACDLSGNGRWNRRQRAAVVVVSFRGNSYTPCMAGLDPRQVAERTAAHVRWICATARTRCVVVGQVAEVEPSDGTVDVAYLNDLYRWYAAVDGFDFLPCGDLIDASLRDVDGVHLTPEGQAVVAGCVAADV